MPLFKWRWRTSHSGLHCFWEEIVPPHIKPERLLRGWRLFPWGEHQELPHGQLLTLSGDVSLKHLCFLSGLVSFKCFFFFLGVQGERGSVMSVMRATSVYFSSSPPPQTHTHTHLLGRKLLEGTCQRMSSLRKSLIRVYLSQADDNCQGEDCRWKRGHILNLTSSGEACMVGLTNSGTKSNHRGWSEHKNSWLKVNCDR